MGSQIQVWESCQTAGPIGTKFSTRLDSSGNGHRLKTIRPTIPQGGIGGGGVRGSTIQNSGKCGQTAGPIGNKMCTYNADESGNGHSQVEQIGPMRYQGEHFDALLSRGNFLGFMGSIFHQKCAECHDLQRKQIKINFLKIKCTNRYNYAATVPGEAG